MYPGKELKDLDTRKRMLRASIAFHRLECEVAGARLAEPLQWVDRAHARWKQITPFFKIASLPMAFAFKRAMFPKLRIFSTVLRCAPAALAAYRSFRSRQA